MSKYCDKCFVDTDKEQHKDWCPNKPSDFMSMFQDIVNPKDKNKNEDDSKRD